MSDDPQPRSRLLALAAIGLAALTASTSGVLVRHVHCGAFTIACVRSGIGALVFLAVLRRPRLSLSRLQVTGAVVFAFHTYVFFAALRLTTVANTVFLTYSAPVFVPFFSVWIVGERADRRDWLPTALVMGGIGLFFLDRLSAAGTWGNVLAVTAGVTFAWYTVILRHRAEEPLATLILASGVTCALAVPFALWDPPSASDWGVLAGMGVFQFGLTYVLISWAIRRLTAMEAMLVLTLEPICAALWAFLFVGEWPAPWALVGAGAVLAGVVLRGALGRRARRRPATCCDD